MKQMSKLIVVIVASALTITAYARTGQDAEPSGDPLHRPFDQILDLYVRDGLVYYRALRSERGRLDRYAASLNVPSATYDKWPRQQKMAFWVNAYNAFVLRTVIDHYPIGGKSDVYPPGSIRLIPGAFDKLRHRAAGRTVTLDEIEKTILPEFKEPRLYLALGRGAIGSGRLKSEAYASGRIVDQLNAVEAEFVNHRTMLKVDRAAGEITVTPIVGWREAEFAAAYAAAAPGTYASRSPIERAIVVFILPHLLPLESEFIRKNDFRVRYHAFDWNLNDLTGGRKER